VKSAELTCPSRFRFCDMLGGVHCILLPYSTERCAGKLHHLVLAPLLNTWLNYLNGLSLSSLGRFCGD
jgi:hypothetical protein